MGAIVLALWCGFIGGFMLALIIDIGSDGLARWLVGKIVAHFALKEQPEPQAGDGKGDEK